MALQSFPTSKHSQGTRRPEVPTKNELHLSHPSRSLTHDYTQVPPTKSVDIKVPITCLRLEAPDCQDM